jgi:uncharacterized OB-fold protein
MSGDTKQVPIAEGLFTWPSESPQLIASRCETCGEVAFPSQASCPACTGSTTKEILLSRRGRLWTWTVQRFPPPTPPFKGDTEHFVPFGVGYIELPEGVRVEARLSTHKASDLEIGMEMELVLEKFLDGEDGSEQMTFAFQPVER